MNQPPTDEELAALDDEWEPFTDEDFAQFDKDWEKVDTWLKVPGNLEGFMERFSAEVKAYLNDPNRETAELNHVDMGNGVMRVIIS